MNTQSQPPAAGEAAHTPTKTALYRESLYAVLPRNAASDAALKFAENMETQNAALVAALADILPRYESAIRDYDNGQGKPLPSETVAIERATAALQSTHP